jgi:phospholipid-translocating P-type ATPase (flippase)
LQAQSWLAVYTEASVALVGREEKLMGVAELIEKDLTLIGATAIEDKLQVGVSETISHLAQANIKLWVLTGDKKETAVNIGFACAVLTQQMYILEIDVHTKEEAASQLQVAQQGLNQTKISGKPVALVVTGASLVFMLDDSLIMDFLAVSCECCSVICCRVSPLQKRLVTLMVKENKKVITLSIGDGANDVPMIQAAHIGVGIRGLEGQQAAAASDYAIAQFRCAPRAPFTKDASDGCCDRYLERLILVHGQWNYRRVSMLILYFFYKCLSFSFCMWLFCLSNGFSGQKIFDDAYQTLYNVIFTSTPIMAFGIFERSLDAPLLLKHPRLYIEGQRNRLFSWTRFFVFAGSGIVTAIVMYYMTMSSYSDTTHHSPDGYGVDTFGIGTNLNTNIIVCVTLLLAIETRTFTAAHVFFSIGSVLIWFIFIIIYGSVSPEALSSFYSYTSLRPSSVVPFTILIFITPFQVFVLLLFVYRNGFISRILAELGVDKRSGLSARVHDEVVADAVSICPPHFFVGIVSPCFVILCRSGMIRSCAM